MEDIGKDKYRLDSIDSHFQSSLHGKKMFSKSSDSDRYTHAYIFINSRLFR